MSTTTRMPNAIPLRQTGSLGPIKVDRVKIPNYTEYVSAEEWNQVCDELIATSTLCLQLAGGGTVGTLQQIYNNGIGPTTSIVLDITRTGILIQDAATAITGPLLQISDMVGTPIYSFNAGSFSLSGGGTGIATDNANGAMKLVGAGARDLNPVANGLGGLGTAITGWASAMIQAVGSPAVVANFNAGAPVFDASLGSVQVTALSSDMTTFSVINLVPGQIITLIFSQNAVGYIFNGTVPAGIILANGDKTFGIPFGTTTAIAITFRHTLSGTLYEIGRSHLTPPPEKTVDTKDLNSTGDVLLEIRKDSSTVVFVSTGTLTRPTYIDLGSTNCQNGDRFTYIFDETTAVTTSTVNTLTLKINGTIAAYANGTALFNQNKKLRGRVEFLFFGGVWNMTVGGSLSYL